MSTSMSNPTSLIWTIPLMTNNYDENSASSPSHPKVDDNPIAPIIFLIVMIVIVVAAALASVCKSTIWRLCTSVPQVLDIETGLQGQRQGQGQGRSSLQPIRLVQFGTVVIYKKKISTSTTSNDGGGSIHSEEEEPCSICLEEFKEGDLCRMLRNCKHVYHIWCIDRCLVKHSRCPLCRAISVSRLRDYNSSSNHY